MTHTHTSLLISIWLAMIGVSEPAAAQSAGPGDPTGFSSGRASFALRVKKETWPYRVVSAFVLPQQQLTLEAISSGPGGSFSAESRDGQLSGERGRWTWKAPAIPGVYPITIAQTAPPDTITLNAFVLVPYDRLEGERLNGYQIGRYPTTPLRGLAIYLPPSGFIEVTPENRRTLLSPHFRLEQFLCKQASGWPKYVVLQERLLLKLEMILEEVNRRGQSVPSLVIMSGYRTPFYNHAIGNVRYSRHVWGGAADIYIDVNPVDGIMDDLNGDGASDHRDAAVLYDIIDAMYGRPWYEPFVGGLGRYRRTRNHGPFVHVDVRGFRARWGN